MSDNEQRSVERAMADLPYEVASLPSASPSLAVAYEFAHGLRAVYRNNCPPRVPLSQIQLPLAPTDPATRHSGLRIALAWGGYHTAAPTGTSLMADIVWEAGLRSPGGIAEVVRSAYSLAQDHQPALTERRMNSTFHRQLEIRAAISARRGQVTRSDDVPELSIGSVSPAGAHVALALIREFTPTILVGCVRAVSATPYWGTAVADWQDSLLDQQHSELDRDLRDMVFDTLSKSPHIGR